MQFAKIIVAGLLENLNNFSKQGVLKYRQKKQILTFKNCIYVARAVGKCYQLTLTT